MANKAGEETGILKQRTMDRDCQKSDCEVASLLQISNFPQRKSTQFVTEPRISDKPAVVNGFQTVFEVEGNAAKLSDLKNAANYSGDPPKDLIRIMPESHAHIINYVVVESEADLRRIHENDPATMRRLMEAQRASAEKMLARLMIGPEVKAGTVPVNQPSNEMMNGAAGAANNVYSAAAARPAGAGTVTGNNMLPYGHTPGGAVIAPAACNSPIQMPMRAHPNLQITAVAGAETVSAYAGNTPTSVAPTLPLITPVPLHTLQKTPPQTMSMDNAVGGGGGGFGGPTADNITDPALLQQKMQADLDALRRTVEILAEAQGMNPQQALAHATSRANNPSVTLNVNVNRGLKRTRQP